MRRSVQGIYEGLESDVGPPGGGMAATSRYDSELRQELHQIDSDLRDELTTINVVGQVVQGVISVGRIIGMDLADKAERKDRKEKAEEAAEKAAEEQRIKQIAEEAAKAAENAKSNDLLDEISQTEDERKIGLTEAKTSDEVDSVNNKALQRLSRLEQVTSGMSPPPPLGYGDPYSDFTDKDRYSVRKAIRNTESAITNELVEAIETENVLTKEVSRQKILSNATVGNRIDSGVKGQLNEVTSVGVDNYINKVSSRLADSSGVNLEPENAREFLVANEGEQFKSFGEDRKALITSVGFHYGADVDTFFIPEERRSFEVFKRSNAWKELDQSTKNKLQGKYLQNWKNWNSDRLNAKRAEFEFQANQIDRLIKRSQTEVGVENVNATRDFHEQLRTLVADHSHDPELAGVVSKWTNTLAGISNEYTSTIPRSVSWDPTLGPIVQPFLEQLQVATEEEATEMREQFELNELQTIGAQFFKVGYSPKDYQEWRMWLWEKYAPESLIVKGSN